MSMHPHFWTAPERSVGDALGGPATTTSATLSHSMPVPIDFMPSEAPPLCLTQIVRQFWDAYYHCV